MLCALYCLCRIHEAKYYAVSSLQVTCAAHRSFLKNSTKEPVYHVNLSQMLQCIILNWNIQYVHLRVK